MEFILYFADTCDWSVDDSKLVEGNSFVIPECENKKLWKNILDQEEEVYISKDDFTLVSIPRMIRELQDAGLWDKLVQEAQEGKKKEKKMPKFENSDDEEQYLSDFAEEWTRTEHPLRDEFIPAAIRLDQDRKRSVESTFLSLMAASDGLRNRTLFLNWGGQGLVCGEVDVTLRPTAGDNIAAAVELADLLDNFVRKHAAQFGFSQAPRLVGIDENHPLIKDKTIQYIGKKDD